MTTSSDEAVKIHQREVQRLLGRCLLRLQQYERLIKAIMADHEISGPAHTLEAARAARTAGTARMTLGALVGDLFGSGVVTNETGTPVDVTSNSPEDVISVGMRMHLSLSDAELTRTKNELRELVDLRNDLVHHFIDQHNIGSLDGCRGAQDALIAAYDRIDKHLEQLRGWAQDMYQCRRAMAEFIQSDVGLDLFVNGIAPDGTVD